VILPAHLDLVTALRAVAGVADAEVVDAAGAGAVGEVAPGGDAGTLRLSLLPGADEVAVATEVNRILHDQFGLAVDAGRVQVVEEPAIAPVRHLEAVGDEGLPPPLGLPGAIPGGSQWTADLPVVTRGGRLLIHRMQVVSAGVGVTTAVTLGFGADTYVGESEGLSTAPSVQRCVAEATLRAVEAAAGERASFQLAEVDVVALGGDQVVVVCVEMTASWGTERLMGASAVREDARQAVIRATLDSINRRLEAVLVE
jgi:hypothetical protein